MTQGCVLKQGLCYCATYTTGKGVCGNEGQERDAPGAKQSTYVQTVNGGENFPT